ncbi:SagB/ThcOx family dehydrogenase [Melioribacter sp. OK-6-Me]|uniref:SagB/ThcOx family dehydrogenase n=1 Tax=unclassified Melioribacter TaxID=2627329 RepID=UPI003ED9EB5C
MKSMFMVFLFLFVGLTKGQENDIIKLSAPEMEGGVPLMTALHKRASNRTFDTLSLSMRQISNLLWAAYGINRPETGKRTAPSAMNWQEYTIYLFIKEGIFIYDATDHSLKKILNGDYRNYCGEQDFVSVAPLNLVYVSDFSKMKSINDDEMKLIFTLADCGFIAQNVYLFCASEGLSVVVRGLIDKEKLGSLLKLKPEEKIILAQTVGYPKK